MSMRSPVSPPLELDGAGTMVNCAVKTEEKKEGGPETPPGVAPSAEPRPHDPPGPPPRDGTDPQALPQESCSPTGDVAEPRRSALEPASSGQEKLDFNRNLKEVMPTIEKLLSSDWKERLLGRNTAESKEVKGGFFTPRDPGEPGREGAAAAGDDQPAVHAAGPAPDGTLGAEEHGHDALREAAAADGAGTAAAGADRQAAAAAHPAAAQDQPPAAADPAGQHALRDDPRLHPQPPAPPGHPRVPAGAAHPAHPLQTSGLPGAAPAQPPSCHAEETRGPGPPPDAGDLAATEPDGQTQRLRAPQCLQFAQFEDEQLPVPHAEPWGHQGAADQPVQPPSGIPGRGRCHHQSHPRRAAAAARPRRGHGGATGQPLPQGARRDRLLPGEGEDGGDPGPPAGRGSADLRDGRLPALPGVQEQQPHQATHERLHGVGQGRAEEDPAGIPGHAQLQHQQDPGIPLEIHVQPGEAAVLRGAGASEPAAPGEVPGLQIQAPAQAHVHRGGQAAARGRVQGADEEPAPGRQAGICDRAAGQPGAPQLLGRAVPAAGGRPAAPAPPGALPAPQRGPHHARHRQHPQPQGRRRWRRWALGGRGGHVPLQRGRGLGGRGQERRRAGGADGLRGDRGTVEGVAGLAATTRRARRVLVGWDSATGELPTCRGVPQGWVPGILVGEDWLGLALVAHGAEATEPGDLVTRLLRCHP